MRRTAPERLTEAAAEKLARLITAAESLLDTGDDAASPGFVEVSARAYLQLQRELQEWIGRTAGIDVTEALIVRHEEEQE